jgi:hypothetical protein
MLHLAMTKRMPGGQPTSSVKQGNGSARHSDHHINACQLRRSFLLNIESSTLRENCTLSLVFVFLDLFNDRVTYTAGARLGGTKLSIIYIYFSLA